METQKIQATITLTLTTEQLLSLLNAAPAQVQTTAPAPMPQPQPTPAQMFPPMQTAPMPAQPTAAPMPQAQPAAAPMPVQPTAAPMPVQPAPAPMPTQTAAPQTYSVTDLGLAARPLMENGRQQELIALIAEFGVPSIAAIPENRRTEFAARLRSLGGQI